MAERKLKDGDEFKVGEDRYVVRDSKLYKLVETEVDNHRCCDHVCWHYMYTAPYRYDLPFTVTSDTTWATVQDSGTHTLMAVK